SHLPAACVVKVNKKCAYMHYIRKFILNFAKKENAKEINIHIITECICNCNDGFSRVGTECGDKIEKWL
ncbi:MAG: hypothetical protein K2K25_08480, partial [Muribaculaceae bacterium]|nr:hypothetical protein [Muribaculaceae bacterium]